jgi:hypothetical protein
MRENRTSGLMRGRLPVHGGREPLYSTLLFFEVMGAFTMITKIFISFTITHMEALLFMEYVGLNIKTNYTKELGL